VPPAHTLRPAGRPVSSDGAAQEFRRAVADLQEGLASQADARPELSFEREPPPRRLAPFATAVAAVVTGSSLAGDAAEADDADIAGGRFVLLFDPAGQPGWDGRYRVIAYVRADLEPEMAADPLINAVGWSWLTEALDSCATGYRNISGTVTTVVTQGFGAKQDEPMSTGFELRASWSPLAAVLARGDDPPESPDNSGGADLAGHLAAWCAVICAAAGLPPLSPGVAALRPPRRRRRQ
jgi:hypothetical protein